MEIKSPGEDKNTTDYYPNRFERNRFKKILAIIDSNKFNYKSKIGGFKYIDSKGLDNNIKNDNISEISAKEVLYTLNKKSTEIIKYKKRNPTQKELLIFFNDLLDTILIDNTLMSSNEEMRNEEMRNEEMGNKEMRNENENENGNENDKTLLSSNEDNVNEIMNQNNDDIIKGLNDDLDKVIDKSKSFEEQIESIKKVESLDEYYYISDYGDEEWEFKIFKLKLAHLSNIIDKKLFKQIFGDIFEALANKLINTTNRQKYQIILINNINENKEKIHEKDETGPFLIMWSNQVIDIII